MAPVASPEFLSVTPRKRRKAHKKQSQDVNRIESKGDLSEVAVHACVWKLPAAHAAHAAHTASLVAVHGAAAYCPAPHTVQGAHTASAAAEHACTV